MLRPLPRKVSDSSLVAGVLRGDEQCLADLYDRHASFVYGIVRHVIVDRQLSEDVLQEVFLTIWRKAALYSPERAGVRTWIAVIAHNKVVDCVRRSERTKALALPTEQLELKTANDDWPGARADEQESLIALLHELRTEDREVIVLVHLIGMTQSQAAERLGIPVGTVKSRIFRAMNCLRSHLGERDDEPR